MFVGGSGLYLRAALDRLEFPGTDPELRALLEAELEEHGPLPLWERLQALDAAAASRMEPSNGRRVVRALEVVMLTGSMPGEMTTYEPWVPTLYLGLDRDDLRERVATRVDRMWERGLVEEVAGLDGLREGVTASRALGYAQALAQLDGEMTEGQAKAATTSATTPLREAAAGVVPPRPADHVAPTRTPGLLDEALAAIGS